MQQLARAPAGSAGAPEQHADDSQHHRRIAAGGQQLDGKFPGNVKVPENAEQMTDALIEELPGMTGEAAAEETAREPTKSVPNSGPPESRKHQSSHRQPQLVPPPMDP